MGARRIVACSLAAAAALAAAPAGAKEGVGARVVSAEARPGARVAVVWTLSTVDGRERRPFNAGGVFIRLAGPAGRGSPRTFAAQWPIGRYRAVVRVPAGGVRRVEIGLLGWNDAGPAPLLFPVVGAERVRQAAARAR